MSLISFALMRSGSVSLFSHMRLVGFLMRRLICLESAFIRISGKMLPDMYLNRLVQSYKLISSISVVPSRVDSLCVTNLTFTLMIISVQVNKRICQQLQQVVVSLRKFTHAI